VWHFTLRRSASKATSTRAINQCRESPFILFKWRKVLVWGDADQPMDFTTDDDAALDADSPRKLHIAGDRISARGLSLVMTELTGRPHTLLRPAGQ